ncbi:hypothetical protein G7067_07205 [Leucobacter insecticola]|uniref:Uncharacterized protein n=1 Tax=Leucobacter insecticola TaxID=2714934 RepID=A0A6G8FIQ9_9MICO|nr:hypothetical protein [Leucobacter insecticola]QIM16257.1 hypothetical protein G7067_07205 [Leucobacter insecticola]
MSDTHFFAATRYLSNRFDRRSGDGDLRYDEDAPGNLMDWFRHATARVPAFPVWDLSCQIEDFFDYDLGLYLPAEWAWSHSDILSMNRELRSHEKWAEAIASALKDPTPSQFGRSLAAQWTEKRSTRFQRSGAM